MYTGGPIRSTVYIHLGLIYIYIYIYIYTHTHIMYIYVIYMYAYWWSDTLYGPFSSRSVPAVEGVDAPLAERWPRERRATGRQCALVRARERQPREAVDVAQARVVHQKAVGPAPGEGSTGHTHMSRKHTHTYVYTHTRTHVHTHAHTHVTQTYTQ